MRISIETITRGSEDGAKAVPAMIRRRLSPVGKLALGALAQLEPRSDEPMVFASSWGDADKGVDLLRQAAREGAVSPMGFSGSVHNAVGAIASIWLKNRLAYRSVSAGCETTEAGLLEAAMELENHESVLFVRYESARPGYYASISLADMPEHSYAWACRITREPACRAGLALELTRNNAAGAKPALDTCGELAFLLNGQAKTLQHGPWLWVKADACI